MDGKIVFEEHMAIPDTLEDSRSFAGGSGKWDEFADRGQGRGFWWKMRGSSSRCAPPYLGLQPSGE